MAGTVSSNLTLIHACDSGGTWEELGSTLQGSQFLAEGIQNDTCRARRVDNTNRGVAFDNNSGIDLSAADTVVGWWIQCQHPSFIQPGTRPLQLLVASNATASANHDSWDVFEDSGSATNPYPIDGAWQRVWIAINEVAADNSPGTSNNNSLRNFGYWVSMGNVPGSAANLKLDAMHYLDGGGVALDVTGGTTPSPATFDDFAAADWRTNANRYGVIIEREGIVFAYLRLGIAQAASSVFNSIGEVVVFPDQRGFVNTDTMGVTISLSNVSTDVDFTNCIFKSAGAEQGDFVVTGTSGLLEANACLFDSLRVVTLTTACTMADCTFNLCGQITGEADIAGSTVSNSAASSALLWNSSADPDGELDSTTWVSDGTGHAIEFGSNTPSSVTLRGHTYVGYALTDGSTGNETIYNNSGGPLTINLAGGSLTPTIRNGAGASTVIVNAVTVSVTVKDAADASNIQNAQVYVEADAGGPLPAMDSVTITRSGSTATVSHTAHGLSDGDQVAIRGADQSEYNGIHTITNTSTNAYDYTVSGTPTTPATGTITSTAVVLTGMTNASGVVEDTGFDFSSNQPVTGFARKGTSFPTYKTGLVGGTITNAGFGTTSFLVGDD